MESGLLQALALSEQRHCARSAECYSQPDSNLLGLGDAVRFKRLAFTSVGRRAMFKIHPTTIAVAVACAVSSAPALAQSSQYGGGLSLSVPLGTDGGARPVVRPWAYGNSSGSAMDSGSGFSSGSGLGTSGSVGSSLGAAVSAGSSLSTSGVTVRKP